MYVFVEENPNCGPEERVFAAHESARRVARVKLTPPSATAPQWCDVTAVEENGTFVPASVVRVDDSADGTAWLVHGGTWGLRLRPSELKKEWNLEEKSQWGVPFLVLDSSASSIEFEAVAS